MSEVWKDIEGYIGKYQVSNLGHVKSIDYRHTGKEQILRPGLGNGYLTVALYRDGKPKTHCVHKLVAMAFIPNPDSRTCIDHLNGIRTDNRADNLRWCTHKENNNNPITVERMKLSHIGQVPVNRKKVICNDIIYDSVTTCARFYNVKRATMNTWLTGYRTMPANFQAKGLRYYIEE